MERNYLILMPGLALCRVELFNSLIFKMIKLLYLLIHIYIKFVECTTVLRHNLTRMSPARRIQGFFCSHRKDLYSTYNCS